MKDHPLNTFLMKEQKNPLAYKPNEETLIAIKELDEGHGTRCVSIDDFWEQMEMNPET